MTQPAPVAPAKPSGITQWKVVLFFAVAVGACFLGPLVGLSSFVYRDFGALAWPSVEFAREAFWKAEFPLWNPYSNCGVPFLAQWGNMVLYPPALIYYILPLPWSLNLFELAHLVWAGVGCWRFLKSRSLSDEASLVGASGFVFCGIGLAMLTWPNYAAAYSWIPWLAMMLPAAAQGDKPVRTILAASMQMMTGVPELILLTWAFSWALSLTTTSPSTWVRTTWRFFLNGVVTLGICAAQLIPFLELLSLSQRLSDTVVETRWNLPLRGMANLIAPLVHTFMASARTFFPHGQLFLSSVYLGVIALVLALVGRPSKRREMIFAWVCIVLLIWFALGKDGFLTQWAIESIPFKGIARFPVKFLILLPLPLAMLAASGFDTLRELSTHSRRIRLVFANLALSGLLVIVTLAAIARPMEYAQPSVTLMNSVARLGFLAISVAALLFFGNNARQCAWALAVLIVIDARFHLPNQNPEAPMSSFQGRVTVPKTPGRDQPERIFITPKAEKKFLDNDMADVGADLLGKRLGQWSHLNLIERTAKVNGSATLRLRWQKEIQSEIYRTNRADNTALLDFLGVTHETSPTNVLEWVSRANARPFATGDAPLRILEQSKIKELMFAADFDPTRAVWVEPSAEAHACASHTNPVVVRNITFEPNLVRISVTNTGPGVVLLTQSHHPGWEVRVDGESTPLLRADLAFQAVPVKAGASEIRMEFVGNSWRIGVAVSLVTLGCALLKGWRSWIIKKAHSV